MGFLNKLGSNVGNAFVDAGKGAVSGALGKAANKLPPILRGPIKGLIGDVFGQNAGGKSVIKVSSEKYLTDWRASLTWPNNHKYADTDIFKFLPQKNNFPVVYWPFTPTVSINYSASYESIQTQQTNIATPAYGSSNISDITVAGEFVAGTIADANYVYAAIHFLKSATRSFNMAEEKKELRGAPPPVLRFNYLGDGGFKNMPVVITGFTMSYPKEVDYVSTGFNFENSMIPAECLIQVTLMRAYSRADLAGDVDATTKYSTESFIKGDLIKGGYF
jgi:hypothetical protein